MKKPRKKYKPKYVLPDPVNWVIGGMRRLDVKQPEIMNLTISIHHAATQLAKGHATRHEMDFLLTASAVTIKLLQQGFGADHEDIASAGRDAVAELVKRGWNDNKFIARGPELTAINEMIELHDAQFEIITMAELDAAITQVLKDIRNKQLLN